MAVHAIFLGVSKCNLTIVACATVLSLQVIVFGDFSAIGLHRELQFEMAYAAGVLHTVGPVGKGNRRHRALIAMLVHQHIAVL